jgi:hypothetical protein
MSETSPFDLWRSAFLNVVQEQDSAAPLKTASLTEDLKIWTSSFTSAIVASCGELGWLAAAKGHRLDENPQAGQEYLSFDVMAFASSPATGRWRLPIAAFELENHRTDGSRWILALESAMFAYRSARRVRIPSRLGRKLSFGRRDLPRCRGQHHNPGTGRRDRRDSTDHW